MRDQRLPTIPRAADLHPTLEPYTPPPEPPRVTDEWIPQPDGSYKIIRPGFRARVAKDGQISFRDDPPVSARILLPTLSNLRDGLVGPVVAWAKDPYEYTRAMGRRTEIDEDRELSPGRPSMRAISAIMDGSPLEKPKQMVFIPLLVVRFDVTDMLMRMAGDDPYRYAKSKLMDETRLVREGMRRRDDTRAYADALHELPGRLADLWRRADVPAVDRRRVLFLLWDECADDGPPELVAAAARARAILERFVRERLPAGSDDAYPDAELDELNRHRTSRAEFRPYGAQ